ncbi:MULTISPECIES: signal peptidase I [Dyella]|uniref:Signal peptidase I n=2 Tax=Dyella TaxID=231454 RepID=A0A4R0Z070_9GAMM|nr:MULTISPECIES: signal peptidase I [Dyella]TBR39680.1 signal peptidase I [Dyella terrae]TCI12738.1 signal peptidase I [Dyella soli]
MRAIYATLARNKGFIAFLFGMLVLRSAIADWNVVPTGSMQPTIRIGDRIMVDKLAYDLRLPFTHVSLVHLSDPKRGDIVVLDSSAANEKLVKRVVGVPGDVVMLRNNRLIVDAQPARYHPVVVQGIRDDTQEPAHYEMESLAGEKHLIRLSSLLRAQDFGPVIVPPGHYLLLGDNRDNSADSRYYGFFPRNEITGRATRVAVSLDPSNHYLPRRDRTGLKLQ